MRSFFRLAWVALFLHAPGMSASMAQEAPPLWAYPVNPPGFTPTPDDGLVRRVPDSDVGYTTPQVRDRFSAPDWHPASHAPLPPVVASGRKPDVSACGYCHRAEGNGGPENASLAGLPFAYIVQQMNDYKSGLRSTAVAKRNPQALMITTAKGLTDDEIRQAAAYFSALQPRQNIRVLETDMVPKTYIANWHLVKSPTAEVEPIGQRIIEVPDVLAHFESRDTRATFTAYVPTGSVDKGRTLAAGTADLKVAACASCHGKDLRGLEAIPSIAGRSPTYIVRQLHEIKAGIRAGAAIQPMKDVAARLKPDDMVSIAAYLASLPP